MCDHRLPVGQDLGIVFWLVQEIHAVSISNPGLTFEKPFHSRTNLPNHIETSKRVYFNELYPARRSSLLCWDSGVYPSALSVH